MEEGVYLNGVDKVLGVGLELPLALIQLIRAGGNHTARANGGLRDITGGITLEQNSFTE